MGSILWVALGGSLGAVARYGAGQLIKAVYPDASWPIATLSVNVLGSLGIGLVFVLLERHCVHEAARLVLLVGFLGGFTTFSTFSLELLLMMERGEWVLSLGYAFISLASCFAGVYFGAQLARGLG
ncbi:MAG: fluoride efflux transporter CrcB [Luminiphilus sp.]|nr:fluoride efflux transporter CrcB [Luminiphilus sp.]